MTVAVVALTLLALALLAALIHERRAASDERQKLLDRVQSPESAQVAAMERAVAQRGEPDKPADPYDEPVPLAPDLELERLLGGP